MDALLTPSGIVGAIGAIAAGVAMALLATVRTLRESLSDLRSRVDDLEKERDGLKVRIAEKEVAHRETQRDLETLKKVVTGEAHWVSIESQLADHHRQALSSWERILAIVQDLAHRWGST